MAASLKVNLGPLDPLDPDQEPCTTKVTEKAYFCLHAISTLICSDILLKRLS